VANQLTQAAFRFLFAPNVTYVGVQVRDLPGGFAQFVAESFVAPESIRVVQRSGESKVVVERSGAWLRTALADNTVDPADLQLDWSMVSGPASVTFTDPFSAETGAILPEEGEYRLRLTASDGSLSSTLDIELTVRSDLEGITAPVGEPLVNDTFDWGTANRSNAQLPPGSGWVFGTNNFSYVANADGTWSGSGSNPYTVLGSAAEGGAIRGNVQHNPRGVQRNFPATADGQRWTTLLVRLVSGFETTGHTAVFSFGNNPSYSGSAIRGEGFGFRQDGSGLRLVAMSGANVVATADGHEPEDEWLLVIAKTTVESDVPDRFDLWTFTANDDFGVTESSLGEPRLTHTGFDWGAGIDNLWVGALRSTAPSPNFEIDELRVSTEGGDRGLGQVIAELDAGIQIGAQVTIGDAGPLQPGQAVWLEATAVDPDSHPSPLSLEWRTVSGPGTVLFSDPAALAPTATFPSAGSYVLRLLADDGAVTTFAERLFTTGAPSAGFVGWIDGFQGIPADRRGPLDDASGDGTPNLLAYARGHDPSDRQHGAGRATVTVEEHDNQLVVTLRIPERLHRPDLHYRLLRSPDLENWIPVAEAVGSTVFSALGDNPPPLLREGESIQVYLPIEKAFFRLEVSLIE
jgi:hypothetical protein